MRTVARETRVSRAALWFGLFGGAVAWTAHLLSAYVAAEFGCTGGLGEYTWLGVTLVAWLEAALTLATATAAGAATVVAYRAHRRLSGAGPSDASIDAERYTAWAGVLTSGLFTFIVLFESIPILFYLHSC